ncbi:MAG: oligosaccharide flippase family protein [Patescibacteria group bacterium]
MIKGLFKRSGGYFVGLMLSKLATTVIVIYLAKLFTPHEFGQVSYLLTLITLATLIGDFGLKQWYQKQVHLFREKQLFGQLLSGRFISLMIFMVLIACLLWTTQPFTQAVSWLILLALIPEAFLSVTDAYYLTKKQPKKIAIKKILVALFPGLAILLFRQQISLLILGSALVIGDLVTLAWYLPWPLLKDWAFSLKRGLKALKQSAGYALLITTSFAYARGDSLIIELQLGHTALGIYSVAYRYLEGLSLLPTALAENLFHISAKKRNLSLNQVGKITLIMLLLGCLVSTGLYFSAGLLTSTLIGPAYALSTPVLQILSLVLVLFFINSPLSTIVQSSDHLKSFLPWGIANTLLNLGLNLTLIPIFGILTAAWTMLVTECLGLIINLIFIKKIYRS